MDLQYNLPPSSIAARPALCRDGSRLLHMSPTASCTDHDFVDLPDLIPPGSALWTNETRVLHARLYGRKPTGGAVELLLLDPDGSSVEQAMTAPSGCTWYVMIGGAKRWKSGALSFDFAGLTAHRLPEKGGRFRVEFHWDSPDTFGSILQLAGSIPLPPYMNRQSDAQDSNRYQTLFAKHLGSVAAPTAGLHFSEDVLSKLSDQGINRGEVTLHVGMGTFLPVSGPLDEHVMHAEQCELSAEALDLLIGQPDRTVVGTTTLRTLESAYWLACLIAPTPPNTLGADHPWAARAEEALAAIESGRAAHIPQWIDRQGLPEFDTFEDAMASLANQARGQAIKFTTEIMVVPGYKIRSTNRLITNFHMPGSTLLCIIEAAVGPSWRAAYAHAVDAGYRFLSYGDACLLSFPSKRG